MVIGILIRSAIRHSQVKHFRARSLSGWTTVLIGMLISSDSVLDDVHGSILHHKYYSVNNLPCQQFKWCLICIIWILRVDFFFRFQRIFAPLAHSVWLMSMVAYFITSVILYIICHFNPYEWRQLHKDKLATLREAESFTCLNAFWFALSTWMWQGKSPDNYIIRVK